jgi:hypothetical protein
MPIQKGQAWGTPGPLPDDGLVVKTDAEARAAIEDARRAGRQLPVIGLLGGDLYRTLGGRATDAGGLRSADAVTFPVDLGAVLVDGRLHWFVAHLIARNRLWTRVFVAVNAQWYGDWNLGPRAHPDDGLLDTYDARLRPSDLLMVRSRLRRGNHLPHPGIVERRAPSVHLSFDRPLSVTLDRVPIGPARTLSVRVEPDALTVVV